MFSWQAWDTQFSSWLISGAAVVADSLRGAAEIGGSFIRRQVSEQYLVIQCHTLSRHLALAAESPLGLA